MKVTINLTKQEAIESLLQFYKHTGASEIVISDEATDDGWISNIGNDEQRHPDSLSYDTEIEVKFRDGGKATGYADNWAFYWQETDKHECSIVSYRIIK